VPGGLEQPPAKEEHQRNRLAAELAVDTQAKQVTVETATAVNALRAAGVSAQALAGVIPPSRFPWVDGTLTGEDLKKASVSAYPQASGRLGCWFLDSPVHDADRTWIVTRMWGAIPSLSSSALPGWRLQDRESATSQSRDRGDQYLWKRSIKDCRPDRRIFRDPGAGLASLG
jgi:transposase InsO family protein